MSETIEGQQAPTNPIPGQDRTGRPPAKVGWHIASLHRCGLPDPEPVNRTIDAAFRLLGEQDFDRRSHFIDGRFENLYLDLSHMPALIPVMDQAIACASLILERPSEALRFGFWFNSMAPGQSTSLHTHEEDDELLSVVYYVTAAPDSGDLVLYDGPAIIRVRPEAGTFLFFPPDLPHAVETNRSQEPRLSIGINIGPR
jgi:mannose-6-phosphate isomerase-like protein (cupin superfamily)